MCALRVDEVFTGEKTWNPGVAQLQKAVADRVSENTSFLDRVLPLDGASHAEVEHYTIEIPMRYAICFAILANGRKVKFKDRKKFLGWSGWERQRSYLFKGDDQYIEIKTNPDRQIALGVPGGVSRIVLGSPVSEDQASTQFFEALRPNSQAVSTRLNEDRKFIAPDGNQVVLAGGCLMVRELSHS